MIHQLINNSDRSLESLVSNISVGQTRREQFDGREHIVAPVSMIVPGVLNGSKGALYYPPEEVARNVDAWNGMPIVVYHPTDDSGSPVSARSKGVIEKSGIGTIFGARIHNGKLKALAYFDVEKTKRVDNRIYQSLMKNEPIELSTGLFTDNVPAQNGAQHDGRSYDYVARNYRPDHLAVLPDQIGACSLRDGCGVLVNTTTTHNCGGKGGKPGPCKGQKRGTSSKPDPDSSGRKPKSVKQVDYHDAGMFSKFKASQLAKEHGGTVHEDPSGKYLVAVGKNQHDPDTAKFLTGNQEQTMQLTANQKRDLIAGLVEKCDCYSERVLNKLDDEDLIEIGQHNGLISNEDDDELEDDEELDEELDEDEDVEDDFEEEEADVTDNRNDMTGKKSVKNKKKPVMDDENEDMEDDEEPVTMKKGKKMAANAGRPMTEDEWLAQAPSSIRATLNHAREVETAEKNRLIGVITSNARNPFSKEQLQGKDLGELRALAQLAEIPAPAPVSRPLMFGAAVPTSNASSNTPKVDSPEYQNSLPVPPTINYSELAKTQRTHATV